MVDVEESCEGREQVGIAARENLRARNGRREIAQGAVVIAFASLTPVIIENDNININHQTKQPQ